jgi:hypothetical protein
MLRRFYCWLLRLHPPYFRQRFADEMVLIFDEKARAEGAAAAAKLVADGAISLGRQWVLRPDFQEEPARPVTDSMPHFLSFASYRPRRGALVYGLVLSVGVFVLFTVAFNFGIHEPLHIQAGGISDSRCKTAHSEKDRGQLESQAAAAKQPNATNPEVTLGPRSNEAQGVWSKFISMFTKPRTAAQLAAKTDPQSPRDGVPLRAVATAKTPERFQGGTSGEIQDLKIQLPHPSGKYGIARVAYDWVDGARHESTEKYPDARRELMVYLWYPIEREAEQTAGAADYLPRAGLLQKNLSRGELEEGWGDSWQRVFSGSVVTDTRKQSPIAIGEEGFPLVVFSPAFGVSSTSYTAQIQEVVSHGYVVASIEPEESAVAFPDGRVVHPAKDAALSPIPAAAGSSRDGESTAWADHRDLMHTAGMPYIESRAADIRFVITQLSALETGSAETFPFAGRINFHDIAVWGHSIGGRAAARACQLDGRIKACLNADGVGPDGPVFPYQSAGLPRQPFMWMDTSQLPPEINSILTSYKVVRKDKSIEKGRLLQLAAQEQELEGCPSGSYHLMINDAGTGHDSFTDWRLLEADRQEDFDKASLALEPIEAYTVAFFDKYLKHQETALLDEPLNTASAQIVLKKYGKAR